MLLSRQHIKVLFKLCCYAALKQHIKVLFKLCYYAALKQHIKVLFKLCHFMTRVLHFNTRSLCIYICICYDVKNQLSECMFCSSSILSTLGFQLASYVFIDVVAVCKSVQCTCNVKKTRWTTTG